VQRSRGFRSAVTGKPFKQAKAVSAIERPFFLGTRIMKRWNRLQPALIACALLFVAPLLADALLLESVSAQEKTLRWKFNSGDRLHVQIEQASQTTRTVRNNDLVMSSTVMMEMEWAVTATGDDGASITQKFTRMKVTMDTPKAGSLEFDSAAEKQPSGDAKLLAAAIKPLIGATVETKLSPQGEVIQAKLSDEVANVVKHAVATTQLKNLFSTSGMQNMLRQSLFVLPGKAVAKGATWEQEQSFDTPVGKISQNHTYTYQGLKADDAATYDQINVVTKLNVVQKDEAGKVTSPIASHSQSGELLFNNEAGHAVRSSVTQTLKSSRTIRDIKVDISSTMKSTMTMKPLATAKLQP